MKKYISPDQFIAMQIKRHVTIINRLVITVLVMPVVLALLSFVYWPASVTPAQMLPGAEIVQPRVSNSPIQGFSAVIIDRTSHQRGAAPGYSYWLVIAIITAEKPCIGLKINKIVKNG